MENITTWPQAFVAVALIIAVTFSLGLFMYGVYELLKDNS